MKEGPSRQITKKKSKSMRDDKAQMVLGFT